jgi:(1->4)-alpha-D-glucan 1-alpha-D-glucosylmutase
VEFAADHGASALLLNPLHPLFPSEPAHASPYSPSNRAWFNTLYLDVEAIPEFHECSEAKVRVASPEFAARLAGLRAGKEVDYATVARAKAEVLDLIYRHFRTHHLAHGTQRAQAFRAFQAQGGESLRAHALFEALQAHFHAADPQVWGWPAWPAAYRDPASPEVAAFAERAAAEVEYFEYLQWQAAEQLARAGQRSWQRWLRVGLMFDLAIGVAEGGAATWAQRDLYALSASIGAPPDEINRMGQDWGLPPWIPHRLREAAYAPFIELLRANMREAGALRIDHVMGLYRLYWVPRGQPASEGAYVRYPFDDLLGILALESQRNRCMVVGEDLGTVPDEVRAALAPMGVFSTRLLYFEREADGSLKPPGAWPENAVVAVTTHDLPTLAGFWQGLDIELRARLALFPDQRVREEQVRLRAEDRKRLLLALEEQGLLPVGADADPAGFPRLTPELAAAVYLYLARAPARLLLVQMEDAFGMDEQANLPGTTWPAYPCWRSRLPVDLESWDDDPWLAALVAAARQERP